MEKIHVICPACKEGMDAPAERESILCMFCGQKIVLGVGTDSGLVESSMELLKQLDACCLVLFEGYESCLELFHKDKYAGVFQSYLDQVTKPYGIIADALQVDDEQVYEDAAKRIVDGAISLVQAENSKSKRERVQMNLNMFAVTYLLPALMQLPIADARKFAELVCKFWNSAFDKTNISAADYDTINGGFRRKLCYVTTAVCLGLHKDENCEELWILKNFRDQVLMNSDEGKRLVSDYYDIAPTIVKRMEKEPNHTTIYEQLYEKYIGPCVALLKDHEYESTVSLYYKMVEELKCSFFTTNTH